MLTGIRSVALGVVIMCMPGVGFFPRAWAESPADAVPVAAKPSAADAGRTLVVLARPVEVGMAKEPKYAWATALIESYCQVRFESREEFTVVPVETLTAHIPLHGDLARNVADNEYLAYGERRKASCVIFHKFEIVDKGMNIQYYLELFTLPGRKVVTSVEKTFPVAALGIELDDCLHRVFKALDVPITPASTSFFKLTMVNTDPKALMALGKAVAELYYERNPDYRKLGQRIEGFLGEDKNMRICHWLAGKAFAAAARHREAAGHFEAFLSGVKTFAPAYAALGRSYFEDKQYDKAIEVTERAVKTGTVSVSLLVDQFRSYLAKGQKDKAYAVALTILARDEREPYSLLFVAQWRNSEGRNKEALELANRLLESQPNSGEAFLEKARALIALKQVDQAIMPLTQATVLLPRVPDPHAYLGDICFDKKDYAKAARHFEEALSVLTEDLELALKAADAHERAGQFPAALAVLKKVEPKHAADRRLNAKMGLLEFGLKDSAGAQRHLEKCLEGSIDDSRIFMALAAVYVGKKEFLKAIRMYEQAMPLVPDKNGLRIELARLFLIKGEPENARTYLEKILEENKKYPGVYRYQGDVARDLGEPAKAVEYYKQERALSGESPYLQEEIARLLFETGNIREAKKEGLQLIQIDPGNADAYYRLSSIFLVEKNLAKAQFYLKEGAKRGEADEQMYYELATGYASLGSYQRAEETYRKCIDKNPGRIPAWIGLGDVQTKAGKDSIAAETYMHIAQTAGSEYADYAARAGKLFEKLGLALKAREAYNFYVGRTSADYNVNVPLAKLESKAGNHDVVIKLLAHQLMKDQLNDEEKMILVGSYIALERYGDALPLLEQIIGGNPGNIRALELGALSAEKLGDLARAIDFYKKYCALPRTSRREEIAHHVGLLYEKLGDRVSAGKWYQETIGNNPRDIRSSGRLAALCFEDEDWACAEATLKRAVALPGVPAELHKMLAQTYEKQNKREEAIRQYDTYLGLAQKDSSALFSMGELHFSRNEFDKAIDPLTKALALMPKNFECAYMLGESYARLGRMEEAVKAFQTARQINARELKAVTALAKCYRSLKDRKNMITMFREWLFLDENNVDIQIALGKALLEEHNTSEGTRYLEAAIKNRPEDVEIRRILAGVYEKTGNERGRLTHLEEALRHAGNNGELLYELGRFYSSLKQRAKAEEYLKKAVEADPGLIRARFEYARLLRERDNIKDAFEHLERCIEQDSHNPEYLIPFSQVAYQVGRRERAVEAIDRVLAQDSANVAALGWAGFLYYDARDIETAERLLKTSVTRDASCGNCYEFLGDVFLYKGEYAVAAGSYEKSLAIRPYNEKLSVKLAKSVLLSGHPAKAAELFEKILSMNAGSDEAFFWLAHAHISVGRPDIAQDLFKRYNFSKKTAWLHLAQGECYENQGKIDAALISFSVASRLMPDEPLTFAATGRMNLVKKEYDDAVVNFSKALASDPNNPDYLIQLGKAYEGLTDYSSALQLYGEVIRLNPHFSEALYLSARALSKSGEHARAITMLEEGRTRTPGDPRILLALGHEYRAANQLLKAVECFEKSTESGSAEYIEAFRYIGSIFHEQLNDPKKAKRYFERYLKAGGTNEDVRRIISGLN